MSSNSQRFVDAQNSTVNEKDRESRSGPGYDGTGPLNRADRMMGSDRRMRTLERFPKRLALFNIAQKGRQHLASRGYGTRKRQSGFRVDRIGLFYLIFVPRVVRRDVSVRSSSRHSSGICPGTRNVVGISIYWIILRKVCRINERRLACWTMKVNPSRSDLFMLSYEH